MIKRVAAFGHSSELYGADRSFYQSVIAIRDQGNHVMVFLPEEGPLVELLAAAGVPVTVRPAISLSHALLTPRGMIRFIGMLLRSLFRADENADYDVVYSNTVAVLDGMIFSFRHRLRHVWHVREIVKKPWVLSVAFRMMVRFGAHLAICNSFETAKWITGGRPSSKVKVVWNGAEIPALDDSLSATRTRARKTFGLSQDAIVLLVAGRINSWKGQDLLIEALDHLDQTLVSQIEVLIVGSPFRGKECLLENLQTRVQTSRYSERIKLAGFQEDMRLAYASADISVIPSRLPEPFGRVAIESMANGLPVVVADHGGLQEIVRNGEGGLRFRPNDATALADAIQVLCKHDLQVWGRMARERVVEEFSDSTYRSNFIAAFQ